MRRALFTPLFLIFSIGCSTQPGQFQVFHENVSYPSGNGTGRGELYRPDTGGPHPAIVLVHSDHGLASMEQMEAYRLTRQGYVVLAVDLYRGTVVADVEDAHIMERGLPEERALGDVKAAVDYLQRRSEVRRDRIGIVGWDMGAGYALDAAIRDQRLQ